MNKLIPSEPDFPFVMVIADKKVNGKKKLRLFSFESKEILNTAFIVCQTVQIALTLNRATICSS